MQERLQMSRVLIVGGGAAGMLASIFAARRGQEVHVYEKNEKLGKEALYYRKRTVQPDECL